MSSTAGEHDGPASDPSPFHSPDATATPTAEVLALVDAARLAAAADVAALTDDQCVGVYSQLELAARALFASALGVLGEIDARDLCDQRYGSSTKVWWERQLGRDRRRVAKDAKVARTLRLHLPELAAALAAGQISLDRAELIASKVNPRNAAAIAATQQELIALSRAEPSFAAFARLVADLANYADTDGGHDPSEATSSLSIDTTGAETVLRGTFVGADGDTMTELLDAATDRLWRQWTRDLQACPDLRAPSRTELRAQALVELVRLGAATIDANAPIRSSVTELTLVVDADRIDGLDPILAGVLNGTGWAPPLNPFDQEHDHACNAGATAGQIIGLPVTHDGKAVYYTAQQWQLLVCNADISEVLLDQLNMPVAVRDRLRTPTRAMRRALDARDGGCTFPGCEAPPSWCDAHHVIHYADDGQTVLVNLALLCRRHHGIVHRSGWSMRLSPTRSAYAQSGAPRRRPGQGLFTITTARGLEMATQHRSRPPTRPAAQRPVREPDRQPALA